MLILTGSGSEFMMASDPEGFALQEADMEYWAYEYAYKDGRINVSALVNDVEIPTIGVLNGFRSEIVLMCDITLAAEEHHVRPALRHRLGARRRHPQRLPGTTRGRARGLRPAHRRGDHRPGRPWSGAWSTRWCPASVISRAYEIADHIMTQPRTGCARLTTQIVRRPWKQRIVENSLDGGFGIQMLGGIKKRAVRGERRVRSTVDYVREGRKIIFVVR